MYYFGEGVSRDPVQAAAWFKKAAEQGHPDAQFNLGIIYLKGEGVAPNLTESVVWLKKAADQGEATAQFNLGMLYSSGRGVPKDPVEAYKWADLAASAGEPNALKLREALHKTLSANQIATAQLKEREWKPVVQ